MTSLLNRFLATLAAVALLGSASFGASAPAGPVPEVVVYGGAPGGIAAAVTAGKAGRRVLLVEPYSFVGGLTTNGLSHPDFRTFEGLNGFYLDFTRRVLAYYEGKYGPDSPQVRDSFRGTHAEPHVGRLIFERMLAEVPAIEVRTRTALAGVETRPGGDGVRIVSATFNGPDGKTASVAAPLWIDATYEGDLLAAAGLGYRVGREARSEYGESLAPEQADRQVQAYNFRLCMTNDPANRVMPVAPPGYRRDDFLGVLPVFESGDIEGVYGYGTNRFIYKLQIPPLPNAKRDINDVSRSPVRLSLPGVVDGWPDGDAAARAAIYAAHVRHNLGMIYFLQNDEAVPEKVRAEAREWGWCKDEWPDRGHVPEQLYVREARRMVGRYVFTENDVAHADGDARAVLRPDAVAMGDYGPNCHGTAHEGPLFGGRHVGEFYKGVPPYQIPYGVIVPEACGNLLVPVACSASHVGFCALRLEPIWSALGQAAGHAAALALDSGVTVDAVPAAAVRRRMHADGAATIYVSDVPPGSADFAAVQWWGSLGGLHGLAPKPAKEGQRGENLVGQYYAAYPGHAANLDEPLTDDLRGRWLALAGKNKVSTDSLDGAKTRGEFIRQAFAGAKSGSSRE